MVSDYSKIKTEIVNLVTSILGSLVNDQDDRSYKSKLENITNKEMLTDVKKYLHWYYKPLPFYFLVLLTIFGFYLFNYNPYWLFALAIIFVIKYSNYQNYRKLVSNKSYEKKIYLIGIQFYDGKPLLKKNRKLAFKYLIRSSEHGHPNAQFWVGAMYYYGRGIEKDYLEAMKWFSKSSRQKNHNATNSLGLMYLKGNAVKQDLNKAGLLFQSAANQGNRYAKKNLDIVAKMKADLTKKNP